MFTYIKLKNFLSFKEVEFDFRDGNKGAKKFVSIYGENGSGKTNFVDSIAFLCNSVYSLSFAKEIDEVIEYAKKEKVSEHLIEMFVSNRNILKQANRCRMVDCDESTYVEYGFKLKGHEGYYVLEFRDRFLYEKLYYFTGKQRGVLFEIAEDDKGITTNFSSKLFGNRKFKEDIEEEIRRFWGKHTLLSILQKTFEDQNETYVRDSVLTHALDALALASNTSVLIGPSSVSPVVNTNRTSCIKIMDLIEGEVAVSERKQLDYTEKILNDFFTQTYADIKDVYYRMHEDEGEIHYKLFVVKMIGGKLRDIEFTRESTGTKKILKIVRYFLSALCGMTVVMDAIDDGIHDLLLRNILTSMVDDITGQLIVTTHNTFMMETINIKSVYVINIDYRGEKVVTCLDKFPRIQKTNNPRDMYLKGLFGGLPVVEELDFGEIKELLNANLEGGD